MVRAAIAALIFIVHALTAVANDSEFHGSGSSLLPMRNTTIRMQREDLQVVFRNDSAYIEVRYAFMNTGKTSTITVGFVTPPPSQEYADDVPPSATPPIARFSVHVNGRDVPYTTKRLRAIKDRPREHVYPMDWVFLFKVAFKPGITHVRHRYAFAAGGSVDARYIIPYRLMTGTHWQGGVIDTFRLTVDVGDSRLVSVPSTFTADTAHPLPWRIIGKGSRADSVGYNFFYEDEAPQPMVAYAIERGRLVLEQTAFHPTQDLQVQIHNGMSLVERLRAPDHAWIETLTCVELDHVVQWLNELGYDDLDEAERHLHTEAMHLLTTQRCR